MFEIGEIVRINESFPGYKRLRFKIVRKYFSDTHRCDVYVLKSMYGVTERHFLPKSIEKDVVYQRKQKLNKICSRMTT
jgi:hypothetical protein